MKRTVVTLLLLFASTALADITVQQEYEPFEPIVVQVQPSNVPEGAQVRASVNIQNAAIRQGAQPNEYHVWAAPGVYTVEATGVWVLTKEITVGEQVVPVLVDFGQYSETKAFTVTGEDPNPDPPDPLPPPQDRWIIIIEETEQRTPEQANLYNQIRAKGTAKVLIADRDAEADTIRQYVGRLDEDKKLPVAFITDSGGKIYHQVELPETVEEVEALLQ